MTTHHTSFRFFDPDSPDSAFAPVTQLLAQDSPLSLALGDALQLADAAARFFRGFFPAESPYFAWGRGDWLPWAYLYHEQDHDGIIHPLPISDEVAEIAARSVRSDCPDLAEMYRHHLFLLESGTDDESVMKGLAVDTMLAVDEFFACVVERRVDSGIHFLSTAYQHIIECTCIAHRLISLVRPQHEPSLCKVGGPWIQRAPD